MRNLKQYMFIWKLILIAQIFLTVTVFTPLVIPKGVYNPGFMGTPYTFWVGILVYILYLVLILVGVTVHSKIFREDSDD